MKENCIDKYREYIMAQINNFITTMKKPLILTMILFLGSLLNGCVLFHGYAPPIQQGNILPANKVNQLQYGMSKQQVLNLLGSPVYTNTFGNDWVYIYSYETLTKPIQTKKVIIAFKDGHITSMQKNLNASIKSNH